MAHRKAGGSTQLGRDSISKRLGVKIFGGQKIKTGQIIIRQRGTKFRPGVGVGRGEDDTLFAKKDGFVKFSARKVRLFTGKLETRRFVAIVSEREEKKAPKKVAAKKTVAKKAPAKKKAVAKKAAK